MANSLTSWDYVVVAVFLFLSAAIGVYYRFTGGQQKTVEEYMLGNRQMSYIPVAFSLVVTIISAVSMLGQSSEYYIFGAQYLLLSVGNFFAMLISIYTFMPVFYRLKQVSVYEYFERRFGRLTRLAASGVYSLQMMLYMGIVLYAPALALSTVIDIDKNILIITIGLVCTFYSTVGGIKAVLMTDTLQALTIIAAFAAIIIKGAHDVGGLGKVMSIAQENGRLEFFNFNFDPTVRHTFWTQAVGGIFFFLTFSVGQNSVQRYLSVPSLARARKGAIFAYLVGLVTTSCTFFAGLVMYANYKKKECDPLLSRQICAADQLLPFYVMELFDGYPGLPGLFIAGVLSGALSTVSSSINSLAAITWEDFIQPFVQHKKLAPWKIAFANKMLAACFGLICIGLSFLAERFTGILQASITIFSVVGGPLVGLFTLGMFIPISSQRSALPSFLIALAISVWLGFGEPKPPLKRLALSTEECDSWPIVNRTCPASAAVKPDDEYFYLYRLSYMWLTPIGTMSTLLLGLVLSLCFPNQGSSVDRELLSPALNRILKSGESNIAKKSSVAPPNTDIDLPETNYRKSSTNGST